VAAGLTAVDRPPDSYKPITKTVGAAGSRTWAATPRDLATSRTCGLFAATSPTQ
jgi:hypothetical protein